MLKTVTLILYAHLRHFADKKELILQVDENETLEKIIERIKVPLSEISVFIISGKKFYEDHIPCDNDIIEVIPAISGG